MTLPAPLPTPANYGPGSVKQDQANTLAVAVRTTLYDAQYDKDWGVMTLENGGHYSGYAEVQDWADLYVAPPPGKEAVQ